MAVDTYDASTTWVCPSGVTVVDVECWGTGGNGGSSGGGGGGGGAYAKTPSYAVTAGNSYTVNIGIVGSSDTYFDTASAVMAKNGGVGALGPSGIKGAGGPDASSIGTTKNKGGSGDNGVSTAGGGGGGSGGSAAIGNSGNGTTGGAAVTDGGAGGNGGTGTGVAGSNGGAPGGGGGGAGATAAIGNGAAGRVQLTYTAATAEGILLLKNDDWFGGVGSSMTGDIAGGYG